MYFKLYWQGPDASRAGALTKTTQLTTWAAPMLTLRKPATENSCS